MRRRLAPLLLALAALVVPAQASAIIRGSTVATGTFPWQVALYITTPDGGALCGGTLIAPDVVLTAAHCTAGQTAGDVQVRAGSRDRDLTFSRSVLEVANHPQTVQDNVPAPRHDVALLKLSSPFTTGTAPLQVLPSGTSVQGELLTVSGWGRTADDDVVEPDETPGEITWVLREAQVTGLPDARCTTAYGAAAYQASNMLCAAGTVEERNLVHDSCNGDSGGPLAWPQLPGSDPAVAGEWVLAGVVSWGSENCGDPDAPGVYARLSAASLNDFASNPTFQPRSSSPPRIEGAAKVGSAVSCAAGTWLNGPTSTTRRVLRLDGPGDTTPEVNALSSYTLAEGDLGRYFGCLETASNAGGTASAMSSLIGPVAPADAPAPTQTTPVTPPPAPVDDVLLVADRTAPTSRVTSRRCTRRGCRMLVRVRDTGSSGAVRSLQARLTRRAGGRTRRVQVSVRRLSSGLYELRTRRIAKARWTLRLRATDLAGNARRSAYRFRVR